MEHIPYNLIFTTKCNDSSNWHFGTQFDLEIKTIWEGELQNKMYKIYWTFLGRSLQDSWRK
jgi:hypothetical protein